MAFGILGVIVALIFILLVIVSATSDRKEMSVASALGSAIFLLVIAALFFISGRVPMGLVFFVFAIYALSRYVKVKKQQASFDPDEEPVSRSLEAGEMSEDEARNILEVSFGANREEVQKAYKRMMMEFHPDRKGNDYMAKKINLARETLLKGK